MMLNVVGHAVRQTPHQTAIVHSLVIAGLPSRCLARHIAMRRMQIPVAMQRRILRSKGYLVLGRCSGLRPWRLGASTFCWLLFVTRSLREAGSRLRGKKADGRVCGAEIICPPNSKQQYICLGGWPPRRGRLDAQRMLSPYHSLPKKRETCPDAPIASAVRADAKQTAAQAAENPSAPPVVRTRGEAQTATSAADSG